MKLPILGMLVVGLFACDDRVPQGPTQDKGGGYQVETLFKHDGCKVYRFRDRGEDRYFVNCGDHGTVSDCNEHTQTHSNGNGGTYTTTTHYPNEVMTTWGAR